MDGFTALLLQDPAPAPAQPEGRPDSSLMTFIIPMVIIFVIFYFMLIRPTRKQQKERDAMLAAVKKNDHVLTTGGIFGVVTRLNEKDVVLKIDERNDVRVRVSRSAIAGVEKTSGSDDEAK
ncbi:MAG: preprotein translocase subunit YajC [Planctomycetota bacterium]|jgi:preprotein translocase subunit YajC